MEVTVIERTTEDEDVDILSEFHHTDDRIEVDEEVIAAVVPDPDDGMCSSCHKSMADSVLIPCGHFSTCSECTDDILDLEAGSEFRCYFQCCAGNLLPIFCHHDGICGGEVTGMPHPHVE